MSARVISFSSGKGGVGKTTLVVNMGTLWAEQDKRVLLIDGDWSLGKLGISLGVRPRWTIEKVLSGEVSLRDAVQAVTPNLSLLASPTGVVGFEELSEAQRQQLFYEIEALGADFDLILFDHSSGIHPGVTQFTAAAHQQVIVTTPEPASYTDAYAIMKVLASRYSIRDFWLMVTHGGKEAETSEIIERFLDVTRSHLGVRVRLLDILPWEPRLNESSRKQKVFVRSYPSDQFTRKLIKAASVLDICPVNPSGGLRYFYQSELQP